MTDKGGRRTSLVERFRRAARRPAFWLATIIALGAVLFFPAITSPLLLDDHLQATMVEGTFPLPRSAFDLYSFFDDDGRSTLIARGLLPWWSHPELTIRFFRPLGSALLYLDHRVFSHRALPMHIHSFAWWAAAAVCAHRLYRKLFTRRVALLATAMFALAPCHALPLAWTANRETLISLVFGALAISIHAQWTETRRWRDGLGAGVLFALALFGGGEYALAFGGYVLAIALTRNRDRIARRITSVLPYLLPAIGYLSVRFALGYGTRGSGYYTDPIRETRAFFTTAPWRSVALLATEWLTLDPEQWHYGRSAVTLVVMTIAGGVALLSVVRHTLSELDERRRASAKWLLLGSVFSLVPMLAVVTTRRLVGASMLGVAATVALVVTHAWFPLSRPKEQLDAKDLTSTDDDDARSGFGARVATPRRTTAASLASVVALLLAFAHLVHGPAISWFSSHGHRRGAVFNAKRATWLRERLADPSKRDVRFMRGIAGTFFMPFALDAQSPLPSWGILSQTNHVLAVRVDERTLDLTASQGSALHPVDEIGLYRSPNAPLRVGDEFEVPGFRVTVLEVARGGARAARFVFDRDPDDFYWLDEKTDAPKEIELPSPHFGEPFDF